MKRHVLITGGGSGIGLATARRLTTDGYTVTVCGRGAGKLEKTGFAFTVMDVTDPESIAAGFFAAAKQNGPVDIVISNAGSAQTSPALKTSLELWNHMIAVNLTGAFLCAQASLPNMVERGFGRFIVVASTAAVKAYPYTLAYASAKHGTLGLVRSLALELAKTGVTCNAVCPGFTDTDIVRGAVQNITAKTGRSEAEAMAAFTKDNPAGRLITPDEVADSIAWLCGEGAASVNGQAIMIDGGESVQ
ncbi:MAG: SDR family oxidoreductase [Robiginitomaculum sp.]|nr:SDR family oxidoreductase [Robiginitomaculum sp.]